MTALRRWHGGAAVALALVIISPAAGQELTGPAPPIPPAVVARDALGRVTVRAVKLEEGIRVDGRLDEAVYDAVVPITGFVQQLPDEGLPGTERTEAWVTFDQNSMYVSARCYETAPPGDWVANEMRRDAIQLRQNDSFSVLFDTFYDRRNGVAFLVNPIGGFADFAVTNEGIVNSDWNPVWDVRTGRFDGGWTVEMEIPFKSLRYRPGEEQLWGIQLRRIIRRRTEASYLTPLPISAARGNSVIAGLWRVSQAASLVGVEPPPRTLKLEVKPYGIGGVTTDINDTPPKHNDPDGDVGFDVKYGVTRNLTADFTYNTDFAQVEVDEQQVNLTRFSLFFPEKREFFLEGRDNFEFARGGAGGRSDAPTIFFSRRIGLQSNVVVPILAGARVTGKAGAFDVGALNIQTRDEDLSGAKSTNFTALRVKRDILRRSTVGGIFTNRSVSLEGNGSNQVYGLDGRFAFYDNVNLLGYVSKTTTPGHKGQDTSYLGDFAYTGDRYGLDLGHLVVEENFIPEVGFVRRNNIRRTTATGRFSPRTPSIARVRRFILEGSLDYIEIADSGFLETRTTAMAFETQFENSDTVSVSVADNYELLTSPFEIAPGVIIPVGGYDFANVGLDFSRSMLEIAARRLGAQASRIVFRQADLMRDEWWTKLPGVSDGIVSTWALHDLGSQENVEAVYARCARALRGRGILLNGDFIKPEGSGHDYEPGRFEVETHLQMLRRVGFTQAECLALFEEELEAPTAAQNYACLRAL